jgi:hypothetical protein
MARTPPAPPKPCVPVEHSPVSPAAMSTTVAYPPSRPTKAPARRQWPSAGAFPSGVEVWRVLGWGWLRACLQCRPTKGVGSKMKKPRQAEPTGVDGGQIALAIGFGEESWMSPSPRCKRLHLRFAGCTGQSPLADDASLHETPSQITPARPWNQAPSRPARWRFPITNPRWIQQAESGFLPRKRSLSGDERLTALRRVASPAVAGLRARKVGRCTPKADFYIQISYLKYHP